MPTYPASVLTDEAARIFAAAGAPAEVSTRMAELLVWSERVGHSSHGLLRIPSYIGQIDDGTLRPDAQPVIVRDSAAVVVVDGSWGFGQIAATSGVELGVERARDSGVAAVGVFHLNHVGRLGDFTEQGARAGMITFAFVGGTPTGARGNVAPFGGSGPVWGTNPLAIAIPGADRIFSLDFATSAIAAGKVMAARARGADLEEPHLIDSQGRRTRDPGALFDGGAIVPFGGHKGYALAFAVELLAGALVGAAAEDLEPGEIHNGLLLVMIDPESFGPTSGFHAAMASVVDAVKACPPAEGFEEVLIPGEPEERRLSESDRTGVEVPISVVDELAEVARALGIESRL